MFRALKALLAGLLAGTALGVLFSPKKGDEIRKDFKRELGEGGSGLKTVKSTLKGLGHEVGESAHDFSQTETLKGNWMTGEEDYYWNDYDTDTYWYALVN